jgi:hypothetical protein
LGKLPGNLQMDLLVLTVLAVLLILGVDWWWAPYSKADTRIAAMENVGVNDNPRQQRTPAEHEYQQVVLDNLALIADSPGRFPMPLNPECRLTSDQIEFTQLVYHRTIVGKLSDSIINHEAFFARTPAARGILDSLPVGWCHVGRESNVPEHPAFVAHSRTTYVWVMPEYWDNLSELTLVILRIEAPPDKPVDQTPVAAPIPKNEITVGALAMHHLWIGLGFAVFLVIVLVVAFFVKKHLSDDQRWILRFLCALCAGFSGALITGNALFEMSGHFSDKVTFAVSGTAGFAMFFAVLFLFDRVACKPPDAFHCTVPKGWTFQKAADVLVQQDGAVAEYIGFTQDELNTQLRATELRTKNVSEALRALRHAAGPSVVRDYDVEFNAPTYSLRIRV